MKSLHRVSVCTFSLFSCSSVLDSMLFKSTEPQDAPIQNTLLHDIVNPLRRCVRARFARYLKKNCGNLIMCMLCPLCVRCSKGFVEGRHIMKLRQQLQKHGYSHSFTTDEKGPFDLEALNQLICLE